MNCDRTFALYLKSRNTPTRDKQDRKALDWKHAFITTSLMEHVLPAKSLPVLLVSRVGVFRNLRYRAKVRSQFIKRSKRQRKCCSGGALPEAWGFEACSTGLTRIPSSLVLFRWGCSPTRVADLREARPREPPERRLAFVWRQMTSTVTRTSKRRPALPPSLLDSFSRLTESSPLLALQP